MAGSNAAPGACGVVAARGGRIACAEVFASPGIGQNLRFRTPDRVGSALAFRDAVVHLEVFPSNGQSRHAYDHTRMAGPWQRAQRGPRH